MTIKYSEIFSSFQGEGFYTGIPTMWVRLWGCNLQCPGFGQKDLCDPDNWQRPWETEDFSKYTSLEQLPIFDVSCDSGYSWSKQIRHLAKSGTSDEIADELINLLTTPHNTTGTFVHEKSKHFSHLAFTGGEPMMHQQAIIDIVMSLVQKEKYPRFITIETNGTKPLKEEFEEFVYNFQSPSTVNGIIPDELGPTELFWSVSPKLRSSGEPWDKTIKPEVVESYSDAFDRGQLKFVVDGSEETWYEVDKAVALYREHGVYWPVYIMPVGATTEQQQSQQTADIAREAISRGYFVAARVHCYVFGNNVGT